MAKEILGAKKVQKLVLTPVQTGILEILYRDHHGIGNKITRVGLRRALQMKGIKVNDRNMREAIEMLRTETEKGAMICSSTKGGYFIGLPVEVLGYCEQDEGRAKAILRRVRRQANRAKRACMPYIR